MKQEVMAEGPRCKRRKQANPRRKNVLNYGSVVEATSDTDEEDQLLLPEENGFRNKGGGRKEERLVEEEEEEEAGSLAGVPPLEASPLIGHALLTHGQQVSSEDWHSQQEPLNWRLSYGSVELDEAVGPKAFDSTGKQTHKQLDTLSDLDEFFLKRKLEGVDGHQATIADFLQRSDTAIIYPEAPEEVVRLSTPEATGQENEHEMAIDATGDFAQLLTCPYCQRGYKRLSSLKEHIRYRHEKEGSVACPLCADTFTHPAQLERHMSIHKVATDQPLPTNEAAGNRKFKCSECGKAFKYKHHLKEHLRIHSGEKPYECSNCKKRFSHSGSYSSHISSKKCIAVNGRVCNGSSGKPCSSPNYITSSPGSPSLTQLRNKQKNGQQHSLLEPQGSLDIKAETLDFNEYRMLMASQQGFGGPGIFLNGQDNSPMGTHNPAQSSIEHLGGLGMDFSALSYAGPFGHHLSDVQRVLQIVDNTMCTQNLEGHPEISKLRADMKKLGAQMEEHKFGLQVEGEGSPRKSITDFNLERANEAKGLTDESKRQVDTKKGKPNHLVELSEDNTLSANQSHFLSFFCQFCGEAFPGPIPLHQHERYLCKMNEDIKAVLQPDSRPPSQHSPVTSEPSSSERIPSPMNPFKNYVSVLKAYFAMNAEPNPEELLKISIAAGLPHECVKELFNGWKNQNHHDLRKKSPTSDRTGADTNRSLSQSPAVDLHTKTRQFLDPRQTTADKALDSLDHLRTESLSPLNLSSMSPQTSQSRSYTPNSLVYQEAHGDVPLDLSLPKHMAKRFMPAKPKVTQPNGLPIQYNGEVSGREQIPGSLDLVNVKKDPFGPDGAEKSVHLREKSASPIFGINPFTGGPIYTSLTHHGAFPPPTLMTPTQAAMPSLRPYAGFDPMGFLPHMAFTYATRSATFAEVQQRRKYQQKPGFQGSELDISCLEEATESDLLLCRKKMKKTESGTYACDLCDKTFQKTSSLLRHKYEHTGKRPHQCQICKKAFKHKHHLIEHSRLHSGEKPYQCDKCGKRFSHSGSYSQHMNHRYSYCKREAEEREAAEREAHHNGEGGPPEGGAAGGGALESHKLLMRSTYLQGLPPLEHRRQEDGMVLRDGGAPKAGVGREEMKVDDRAHREVTDGQVAPLREGEDVEDEEVEEEEEEEEEEENHAGRMTSVNQEETKDSPPLMDKSSGGGTSGDD